MKCNLQLNNKLNKPSDDFTASGVPQVQPWCYRVDLNEWNLIKKKITRFPSNLSSFVHQPVSNSPWGTRSGCPEHWDTMENSQSWPSAQIPNPPLPADGKPELGVPRGALGSTWGGSLEHPSLLGMLSWRKHNPSNWNERWEEHLSSQQQGNVSIAILQHQRELETISEQLGFHLDQNVFIFLLPGMNLIWHFLLITPIWNSSIWEQVPLQALLLHDRCKCSSTAPSASSSSVPFLFQTSNVHLYSLMVRKEIYGGNKFHILVFHPDSLPFFFNSKPSFQGSPLKSPIQISIFHYKESLLPAKPGLHWMLMEFTN